MFCQECGNKLPKGTRFCINCGMKQPVSYPSTNSPPYSTHFPEQKSSNVPEQKSFQGATNVPNSVKQKDTMLIGVIVAAIVALVLIMGALAFFLLRPSTEMAPDFPNMERDRESELEPVEIPDFTGLSEADAIALIDSLGLSLGTITKEYEELVEEGFVFGQYPRAGTVAYQGFDVDLTVSLGFERITVLDRTVRFGIAVDASSLDPHRTLDNSSIIIMGHIYETLVGKNNNQEIYPVLATDWRQIDDLTWEFDLRDDVYFHNGEHFTAYDVVFTLTRALDEDAGPIYPAASFLDVYSYEVVDTYTVRIGTLEPFAPILSHLAHPAMAMLSQVAIEYYGENHELAPVGTGPFMFYDWEPHVGIQMVRNDDYWGNPPQFKRLESVIIPDSAGRVLALEAGEIDIAIGIHPLDYTRLNDNPDVTLEVIDGMVKSLMYMNNEIPGLDDPRVRQAIIYAIDVELMVEVVWEGARTFADSMLPPTVFGAVPGGNPYRQDVDRARELMAEAGFADGLSLTITTNGDNAPRVAMAEFIEEQLAEINIEIHINLMDFYDMLEMLDRNEGEHELVILGWTILTGDADYALFPLYHSSSHGAVGNRSNFSNAQLDELLENARATSDPEARMAYYAEAQEILAEYAPTMMIDFSTLQSAWGPYIRGFEQSVFGHHFFGNIVVSETRLILT